jgi:hypothetical protein
VDDIIGAMLAGGAVPMGPVAHLLGYGLGCLLLGMLVVRVRPMGGG